jgi:hypothetical protein
VNITQSRSEENLVHLFSRALAGPTEIPFSEAVISYALKECGLKLVKEDFNGVDLKK